MSLSTRASSSLSTNSPPSDGSQSMRQLHNLNIAIDTINGTPMPDSEPSPPAPRQPPRRSDTSLTLVSNSSNVSAAKPPNKKTSSGPRYPMKRKMVFEADYFFAGKFDPREEPKIKKSKMTAKVQELLLTILDHVECSIEQRAKEGSPSMETVLPEFPKKFHNNIAELVVEVYQTIHMRLNVVQIYNVIHECVKLMPGCSEAPFSHFSVFSVDVLYDDELFAAALRCSNPLLTYSD